MFVGCYSVWCDDLADILMAFGVNITGDSQMDYTRATYTRSNTREESSLVAGTPEHILHVAVDQVPVTH